MSSNSRYVKATPFLRWVGGKRRLASSLLKYLPRDIGKRLYCEPFVGAGSLFFALQPQKARISDLNDHLIRCYRAVRDKPDLVSGYLNDHAKKSCKEYYYEVRSKYNRCNNRDLFSVAQAARFIYLNQTCFNGVFRVNKKGEYNVPYGLKEPPFLPSLDHLRSVSEALKRARLAILPFEESFAAASASNFYYLDPPYPPLNGTAYFTHYTTARFNEDDQRRLAEHIEQLDSRGCKFMMTNAGMSLIKELYSRFKIVELPATRYVSCRKRKHRVSDVVITNYDSFLGSL